MAALKELISFIESPLTIENERERAISELNLMGIDEDTITQLSYEYWQGYFEVHLEEILKARIVVVSHLLPDGLLNQCFEDVFEEYRNRKKDLGIDITKFWAP